MNNLQVLREKLLYDINLNYLLIKNGFNLYLTP
jgi:hypothetical protein